jgi:hypothetical protein
MDTILSKLNSKLVIAVLLVGAMFLSIGGTTLTAEAQYGEYVRCEQISDPAKKAACNARTKEIIENRIAKFNRQAQKRIEKILASNAKNKNALILSALNVAKWEIWNLYNVIFPTVTR